MDRMTHTVLKFIQHEKQNVFAFIFPLSYLKLYKKKKAMEAVPQLTGRG